eukprot:Platyproteum_vivax@DN5487_c0_g1_i1.p1
MCLKGLSTFNSTRRQKLQLQLKKMNGTELNDRNIKVLVSRPTKQLYDSNTLFVKGLLSTTREKEVFDAFKKFGPVKEVRLKEHNRKCMGHCYVEFESDEGLKAALQQGDTLMMNGVLLQLAKSVPMKTAQEKIMAPHNKTGRQLQIEEEKGLKRSDKAKRTVIVKDLARQVKDDALREHFTECGPITDLLVCTKSGKPRGFGFVEFADIESCTNALMKNNSLLAGKNISVGNSQREISHAKVVPPTSPTAVSPKPKSAVKLFAPPQAMKSRIKVDSPPSEEKPTSGEALSNKDFRKFLQ